MFDNSLSNRADAIQLSYVVLNKGTLYWTRIFTSFKKILFSRTLLMATDNIPLTTTELVKGDF